MKSSILTIKEVGSCKNIPTNNLKKSTKISCEYLGKILNEQVIMQKILPNELKLADITPILKKDDFMLAKNKRPISVLPWISKIFEKRIENSYFNT